MHTANLHPRPIPPYITLLLLTPVAFSSLSRRSLDKLKGNPDGENSWDAGATSNSNVAKKGGNDAAVVPEEKGGEDERLPKEGAESQPEPDASVTMQSQDEPPAATVVTNPHIKGRLGNGRKKRQSVPRAVAPEPEPKPPKQTVFGGESMRGAKLMPNERHGHLLASAPISNADVAFSSQMPPSRRPSLPTPSRST